MYWIFFLNGLPVRQSKYFKLEYKKKISIFFRNVYDLL